MSQQSPPPPPPPPSPGRSPRGTGSGRESLPRWSIWVLAGVILAVLVLPSFMNRTDRREIDYSDLLTRVEQGQIEELDWNNNDGSITGQLDDGTEFESNGPLEPSEDDRALFREHDVTVQFSSPGSSWLTALLPLLIPVALFIGIFWLMQRRAESPKGGLMSLGRSRAKTYSTERPGTTFADVAGYEGVKQEITEGVVMMAATNRPDILDPALLRPGRFDRQVVVPLPEIEERRAILDVHCKSKRLAAAVDLDVVARGTPGMSGADLANLVNEAALFAVRDGS